ncbi:YhcN/YlaJ family sporulation lipoprotein [Shimazuella kribbensis]|uniref:YhcN/YlaJ family sporulation lipoprotein n=1 Tax=Shimazuella kribbensis TaxID=139808 RepID=UPI00040F7FBE|nr:YhcN/YlaJ family sporulation lipoprotein [Shimazuella kribbensis]
MLRNLAFSLVLLISTSFLGCARYHSQSPVQEQNMLPTRYHTNIDHTNSLYTKNANFISQKTPNNGVRVEKRIAQMILKTYPKLKAATVVIIKNRAYVAVSLDSRTSTLGHLRVEIPALIKDMDAAVEKVYVSDNPNFRRMVEQYRK